jgi:hypothetical protein
MAKLIPNVGEMRALLAKYTKRESKQTPVNFKQKILAARCGELIELAHGEYVDVLPHCYGMIGCLETNDGKLVHINDEPHHILQGTMLRPFGDDVVCKIGLDVLRVRKNKHGPRHSVLFRAPEGISFAEPFENGLCIVDEKLTSIATVAVPGLRNAYGWIRRRRVTTTFDQFACDRHGLYMYANGHCLKNGKQICSLSEKEVAEFEGFYPHAHGIALFRDGKVYEPGSSEPLFPGYDAQGVKISPSDVYSCNGVLAFVSGNDFWYFSPDEAVPESARTLTHVTIAHQEVIPHWNGLLIRSGTTWSILVIK